MSELKPLIDEIQQELSSHVISMDNVNVLMTHSYGSWVALLVVATGSGASQEEAAKDLLIEIRKKLPVGEG